MEIRIMESLVRVCVFGDNGELLKDEWITQQTPQTQESEDMVYKIQRRVMIGGVMQNIRANTEQDYADKVGWLTLTAHNKEQQKKEDEARVNFGRYAKRWYKTICEPNLEKSSQLTYARNLNNYIYPALEHLYIDEITPEAVQELLNSMGDDKAKATKNKMMMILKQILDAAVEDKIITTNPAKSKRLKQKGKKSETRKAYSVEQMRYIINNVEKIKRPEDRAYTALIALHPMRPEEVLGLRWEDINFTESTITITKAVTHPDRNQPVVKEPKTEDSGRTIGLTQKAKDILLTMKGEGFVFGGETPYSYTTVRRACERIKKDLDFEEAITPSRFRPTVISDMYAQTGDLKAVQEAAGHANVDTTLKHYISTRTNVQTGAEAINSLYTQQKAQQDNV